MVCEVCVCMIVLPVMGCWCAVFRPPAPFSLPIASTAVSCCASASMLAAGSLAHLVRPIQKSLSRPPSPTRCPFATRSALLCAAGLVCLLCRRSSACCLAPAGLASCLAASPAGWAAVHLAAAMQRHRLQPGAHTTTRPARNKLRCAAPTPRPAPTTERRQACPCSAPSAQPCAVRVRVCVCGGPPGHADSPKPTCPGPISPAPTPRPPATDKARFHTRSKHGLPSAAGRLRSLSRVRVPGALCILESARCPVWKYVVCPCLSLWMGIAGVDGCEDTDRVGGSDGLSTSCVA